MQHYDKLTWVGYYKLYVQVQHYQVKSFLAPQQKIVVLNASIHKQGENYHDYKMVGDCK